MSYDEYVNLISKLDVIVSKIDAIGQRLTAVETKQSIYTKFLTWGGTTIVGFLSAISLKIFF